MQRWKILVILAATVTLTISVIGMAAAHYATYQPNPYTNAPYTQTQNSDFWGWLRGCFGWGPNQPYYGDQHQSPTNSTVEPPKTYVPPQYPYPPEGYYQYRGGRGCWGW